MDEKSALQIIEALADGADPMTGEVLPNDSPCQHPNVIRALFAAIEALKIRERHRERKRTLPEETGSPWTSQRDEELVKAFEAGKSINQIADTMKRTSGGIEARLVRLGKIVPDHGERDKWWPGHTQST